MKRLKIYSLIFGIPFIVSILIVAILSNYQYIDSLKTPSVYENISYMKNYLVSNPGDVTSKIRLSTLYSQAGNTNESKKILINLTNSTPKSSTAWYNLALFYIGKNQFDKADNSLNKVIEIDSDKSYGYFYLSNVLLLTNVDKSISTAAQSLKIATNNKEADTKFNQSYLNCLKQFRSMIKSNNIYSAYIYLIKSDYIYFTTIKKSLIEKALILPSDNIYNTNIKRTELIQLKSKLVDN